MDALLARWKSINVLLFHLLCFVFECVRSIIVFFHWFAIFFVHKNTLCLFCLFLLSHKFGFIKFTLKTCQAIQRERGGKQCSCCWKEKGGFRNWQLIRRIIDWRLEKKRVRQALLGRHLEFVTFISLCGLNWGIFQQVTLNSHVLTAAGSFATKIGSFLSLPTKFKAPDGTQIPQRCFVFVFVGLFFFISCNSIIWAGLIQIWLLIFRNVYTIGFVVASPGSEEAPTKFE